MKKKIKGIVCLMSAIVIVAFMASSAKAVPIASVPIQMIDGSGDANLLVSILVQDSTSAYDFGYLDSGFNLIITDGVTLTSFNHFDIVDFAITNYINTYSLGAGDALLEFTGSATSPYPVVTIDWDTNGDGLYGTINGDVGISVAVALNSSSGDGFAPYYANGNPTGNSTVVPEPSTLVLLGSGLVGLSLWRRKKTSRA